MRGKKRKAEVREEERRGNGQAEKEDKKENEIHVDLSKL